MEYLEHALESGMTVEVDVSFNPVGTFKNNWGLSQEQFVNEVRMQKQRFAIRGYPNSNVQQIRMTIERYLKGLNATYGGNFTYRIDQYNVEMRWM